MSGLALIVFAGIVVALYLVSDHISSRPRINETEREIIERTVESMKIETFEDDRGAITCVNIDGVLFFQEFREYCRDISANPALFICSGCKASVSLHVFVNGKERAPLFCPNCGSKVVEE